MLTWRTMVSVQQNVQSQGPANGNGNGLRKKMDNNRMHWEFEEGTLFKAVKNQVVKEVDETLNLLGWTRLALARHMNVQPSAVTQSLDPDKGLQLTTLIRMADAMGCDVEVNFIRRPPYTMAVPAEV